VTQPYLYCSYVFQCLQICCMQLLDYVWVVVSGFATLISSCFPPIVGFTESVCVCVCVREREQDSPMCRPTCIETCLSLIWSDFHCFIRQVSLMVLCPCVCVHTPLITFWIMKLGMNVMSLEVTPTFVLFNIVINGINMALEQMSEVLIAVNIGLWNFICCW